MLETNNHIKMYLSRMPINLLFIFAGILSNTKHIDTDQAEYQVMKTYKVIGKLISTSWYGNIAVL
jgi:hypothetical protein